VPVHFAHPVGVEDWRARRLRDVLRIIHGLPTGSRFGDLAEAAAASSLAPFVAACAAFAAPPACLRRTFARALARPSNRSLVCISAAFA
jgi:hypothetical protein